MSKNKFKPLIVKDNNEKYHYNKERIFGLPMRLIIVGASGSGKTNTLLNLLCRDEFYNKDLHGDNMYLISPSLRNDYKIGQLVKFKKLDKGNCFSKYSDDLIEGIYEMLQDEYEEYIQDKKKPPMYSLVLDDCGFNNFLKSSQSIKKAYMNGRHINLNTIILLQRFQDLSLGVRSNANGLILYNVSNKVLDSIEEEFNYSELNKQEFKTMFRDNVKSKHDFIVINFTNKPEEMYLNKEFEIINMNNYKKDNIKKNKITL